MADDWGNEFVLTLIEGFVGETGPPVKTWNGNISSDWAEDLNWTPAGAPTMTDNVEIGPVEAFPPVILTGTAVTGMLTILPGANLTVMGGLTTNGMFTNDGEFFVDDGSYIDLGGMMGTGMFQYNRSGASTKTSFDGWHYLSSPITGFTSDEILDYYLNTWEQPAGMWMQHGGTTPCTPMAAMPLNVMEAWSINFDEGFATECPLLVGTGDVIEFMSLGVPFNTGAYGMGLGYGAGMYQEWNLLGNPYPSFVDPAAIAFDANVVSSIAFWDGSAMNYEYWAATVPAATIPPTNGFFVETLGTPAPFGFTGAERTHTATPWWKEDITQLLTLQASNGAQTDKLHIRFMDNMSASFDTKGDAHKLISTATGVPQIYTTVGDEMLAINALPETAMVPMGFTSATTGTYTIEAIETTDFVNVVLEDRTTGEKTNLLTSSYTFDYTVGDNANRFFVHFTPLGSSDMEANSVNIWSSEQNIVVDSPADMTGTVVVYNMMGQEVVSAEMEPLRTVIPMNDVNTYYVVKVLTNDNAVTGKVYIK
jgi:hypothetical protein